MPYVNGKYVSESRSRQARKISPSLPDQASSVAKAVAASRANTPSVAAGVAKGAKDALFPSSDKVSSPKVSKLKTTVPTRVKQVASASNSKIQGLKPGAPPAGTKTRTYNIGGQTVYIDDQNRRWSKPGS